MYNEYSFKDVLKGSLLVLKKNYKKFTFLFILEFICLILLVIFLQKNMIDTFNTFFYHLFKKRFDMLEVIFENNMFIFLLIWGPISISIKALMTKIGSDTILEKDTTLLETIIYTGKHIIKFLISSLVIWFVFILSYVCYFVFMLLPLFNLLILISLAIIMIYFMTYNRFAPSLALISASIDESFGKAKASIEGHFLFSLIIMLLAGGSIVVLDLFRPIHSDLLYDLNLLIWCLITFVMTVIAYTIRIIDISFITIGYTCEENNNEIKRERFKNKYKSDVL